MNVEVEVYKDVQEQISEMVCRYKEEIYDFNRKRPVNEVLGDIEYLISYLYLLKKQHINNLEYCMLIDKFIMEVSMEVQRIKRGFEKVNYSKRR